MEAPSDPDDDDYFEKNLELISEEDTGHVIDRSKIRREREKFGTTLQEEEETFVLKSIYFDGTKDRTLKFENIDGRLHKKWIIEAHLVLIEEHLSRYIGRVVPDSGNAVQSTKSTLGYLVDKYDLSELVALGCDGTPTNTGPKGGIIHLTESTLGRSVHWFVCQLHGNELPLRHLFQYLDGKTTGLKCCSGPIRILLQKCETLPLVKYKPIETKANLPALDCKDLSTEQKY
nr:unnamed protein product [Callosobruchus analis]